MKSRHILALAIVVLVVIVLIPVARYVYSRATDPSFRLLVRGTSTPTDVLLKNLESNDRDMVIDSLSILADKRDSSGREKARELLSSDDEYVWLNAALYLAAIGDDASIPYLIRGLNHPAYRAVDDIVAYLETLTGQSFGRDQEKWTEWWASEQPDSIP
jgi:hypothetical protein